MTKKRDGVIVHKHSLSEQFPEHSLQISCHLPKGTGFCDAVTTAMNINCSFRKAGINTKLITRPNLISQKYNVIRFQLVIQ